MNARVTPGSAVRPQDLAGGSFQSLVAGWEYNTSQGKGVTATTVAAFPTKSIMCDLPDFKQVTCNTNTLPVSEQMTHSVHFENEPTTRPNSIFNSSLFRSSSNLYAASSAGTSPSGSVGSTSVTSRNAALREQFLTNGNLAVTPTPSTPTTPSRQFADPPGSDVASHHTTAQSPSYLRTPTTPTYGGSGYRFAGVERLAQRSKIYETPVLTINNGGAVKSDNDALNSKREYYFRDSASPTSTLSNGSKDYVSTRDRLESMGFSNRNGEDLKTSTISKDGEQFVGFSYLPNQIHRKTVKKGFEFTLMVVGESGLGKSTLVNSMFLTDIYSNEYPGPSKRATKTVEVETTRVLLKEKSVNLHLTVVDTPGYGFAMNNTDCWQPIVNFIENRYEEYLNAETRVHRTHIQDNRVHCCLYFISPSGHSLKPIDIEFMLHLHDKVNIIPVIAKADTMTPEEIVQFKKNVLNEINQHKIKIYDFPESDEEEDSKLLKSLKSRVPFAVVGSNYVFDLNGERKRSRKYPWGIVEIENLEHCDFQALRNLVIRHYMLDLLETTNNVHYENYRCRKLTGISPEMAKKGKDNKNPLAQMEEEKKEHDQKMKKMEVEMEQVFEQKVKEKLSKLEESKEEYLRRHEEMTKKLEKERQELEEKRAAFEKEKAAFELVSKDMEEIRRVNTLDVNMRELNLDGKIKEKKKKGLF